ncbi:MAG: viroplasmin family protein [Clostridiales bacterium]|nr:viroplasmin family protein [Clostridiales bacterium]
MAKNKFYAVKKGHKTGVFSTWSECQAVINGYPNANYKSFATEAEAIAYLSGTDIYMDQIKNDLSQGYVVAYTDGSYDETTNEYAYGLCLFDKDGQEIGLCNKDNYPPFASSRNIAGEIFGVLTALDWAVSNGYDKIRIYHDLEGVAKWATGEYTADSEISKYYVQQLAKKFDGIIAYEFVKVAGHSNNPYNDKADNLASSALKGERKMIKGANSFFVSNIEKSDIDTIVDLILECYSDAKAERKLILGGEQVKLNIGNKSTMIKTYNNKNLLVQGKPNITYQVVFSYISELLGESKVVSLVKQAYRMRVDTTALEANYSNLCPNLPEPYNSTIKTLIRQAIINLNGYFDAEEYGQYAFPALRAMEGHIKYLLGKHKIVVGHSFEQFTGSPATGFTLKSPDYSVPSPYGDDIEKCYTYYHKSRHKIFHFGDLIGGADNTMLINTKEEADKIIREALNLINNTAY